MNLIRVLFFILLTACSIFGQDIKTTEIKIFEEFTPSIIDAKKILIMRDHGGPGQKEPIDAESEFRVAPQSVSPDRSRTPDCTGLRDEVGGRAWWVSAVPGTAVADLALD